MPDLSTTGLAQTFKSAAATAAEIWEAIPGGVWIALYAAWVIGSVMYIVMQRRRPTATLAWIVGFIGIPLFGAVVYYFFGPRKLRRRKIRRDLQQIERFSRITISSQRESIQSFIINVNLLSA